MILQFKNIKLVNFGSFGETEIALNDKGFCLVSGENHYIKDNALSNGSGKSTIWSAICYALTGETIQGLTANLKNINIDKDECSVILELNVDKDNYIINRTYRPKSDLKVIKNDIDISGKGVRESEKILATNLPDLTKDLIASTIILGQGMPNKFSSFTPSGRKALLEKLTKSDFMIEDIKNRITERQTEINTLVRNYADSILVNKTNLTSSQQALQIATNELEKLTKQDFDSEIEDLNKKLKAIEEDLKNSQLALTKEEKLVEEKNNELLQLTTSQATEITTLNESYNSSTTENKNNKYKLELELQAAQTELKKLQSITDVCPTCGQKLPNVLKPDTSELEAKIVQLKSQIKELTEKLSNADVKYKNYKKEIENNFANQIVTLQQTLNTSKQAIRQYKDNINDFSHYLELEKNELNKLLYNKETYLKQITSSKKQIETLNESINSLTNAITISETAKNETEEHLAILKKMTTLIQRDFRGYLLEDIIKYIDAKAKEYCQVVFGTTDLNVYLAGNALDITYCGKLFDSLSGGEKQRCDLILQFAIRDLLQNYLNYSSNILVLDEIFDGLDRKSTDKIIELITNKLKDVESIFIISHHSDELELPIDSEIKVVKSEEGVSEIQ